MKECKKTSWYNLVKEESENKSLFHVSGTYNSKMSSWLLVWILKVSNGALSLKDIQVILKDLTDVVRQAGDSKFFPCFNEDLDVPSFEFDGQWYSIHKTLERLCREGYLEHGMPSYQLIEKGRVELSELEQAIAEFLLHLGDIEVVEQIIKKLLIGREVAPKQLITRIYAQRRDDF